MLPIALLFLKNRVPIKRLNNISINLKIIYSWKSMYLFKKFHEENISNTRDICFKYNDFFELTNIVLVI